MLRFTLSNCPLFHMPPSKRDVRIHLLIVCVLRAFIYVVPVPCAQPPYIHFERSKDVYIRHWLLEKITRHAKGFKPSFVRQE